MKKLLLGIILVLSGLGVVTTPAAANGLTAAAGCEGTSSREDARMSARITYNYVTGEGCQIGTFSASGKAGNVNYDGRYEYWGPRGWETVSGNMKFLTQHSVWVGRNSYRNELWCVRFRINTGFEYAHLCIPHER